jgi:hypothetical protein
MRGKARMKRVQREQTPLGKGNGQFNHKHGQGKAESRRWQRGVAEDGAEDRGSTESI